MADDLPRLYRAIRRFVRILVRLFFREIGVEGLDRIPRGVGGLVVSWHPNALIDPALIFAFFPGRIAFGARHGLFDWPLIGRLIRIAGAVPIYRASDASSLSAEERRAANERSLDALASELAAGSFSALFPEGVSHDEPKLADLKTGAARLYYRARELALDGRPPPVIVPVGLHYDRKQSFRSRVLVSFGDPVVLPPEIDVRPGEGEPVRIRRERYRSLTDLIEQNLVETVHLTEDWETHHLMHRVRKLMRAERADRAGANPGKPTISEREAGFARIWYGHRERLQTHPAAVASIVHEVQRYDMLLQAMGLEDHEINLKPRLASPVMLGVLLLQIVTVYLVLPPVLLIGFLINGLPYLLLKWMSGRLAKANKDEATIKLLGGAVLYPLTWIVVAYVASRAHTALHVAYTWIPDVPFAVAVLTVIVAILGGLLALIYNELARQTLRAVRVRITRTRRRRTMDLLRSIRSHLYEEFYRLAEGLELPGSVGWDGRIRNADDRQ